MLCTVARAPVRDMLPSFGVGGGAHAPVFMRMVGRLALLLGRWHTERAVLC